MFTSHHEWGERVSEKWRKSVTYYINYPKEETKIWWFFQKKVVSNLFNLITRSFVNIFKVWKKKRGKINIYEVGGRLKSRGKSGIKGEGNFRDSGKVWIQGNQNLFWKRPNMFKHL